jgi:hypothetical protein
MTSTSFLFLFAFRVVHAYPIPLETRDVFCTTATWETVVSFFLLNYGVHVLTIKTFPGDKTMVKLGWITAALLIPFSGVARAANAIAHGRLPFSKETELERAARVGALCAIARSGTWKPLAGEDISGCRTQGIDEPKTEDEVVSGMLEVVRFDDSVTVISDTDQRINGHIYNLPPEYEIQILPENIRLSAHNGKVELASSQNILAYVASLIQLGFAVVTLYRVSGNQLDKYGYAAYGLTIIPYMMMSFVNLLAQIFNPDYPLIYMVQSHVMEEAKKQGALFDGVVGELETDPEADGLTLHFEESSDELVRFKYPRTIDVPEKPVAGDRAVVADAVPADTTPATDKIVAVDTTVAEDTPLNAAESTAKVTIDSLGPHKMGTPRSRAWWTFSAWIIAIVALAAPYVIIAALTGFQSKQSTSSQRGWLMSWLVMGQVFGVLMSTLQLTRGAGDENTFLGILILLVSICGAPPIGGFVVVAEMILSLPVCGIVS